MSMQVTSSLLQHINSYDSLNEMGYSLSEIKNILKKSVDKVDML